MIFGINATREITYNNFEISLVVFMPNITTNHAITYTNVVGGTVFSFFQELFDPVQRKNKTK